MVFQLLPLGRRSTKNGTSALHQVRAGHGQWFVDHKIFLLPTEGSGYFGNIFIEIVTNIYRCFVQWFQCFQQWGFVVEWFAGIRNKDGRDTQRFTMSDLDDKSRGWRIPGCITTRFKSGTDTAAGEGRCIGLLLDQGRAIKFFDGSTITFQGKKRVMFFSSGAG